MTASEIIAIISSLGTFVGVVVTAILTIRNGFKSDVIATHVNSMATAREEKIDGLIRQVAEMTEDKARKAQIAALLAQKQAGEVTVAVIEPEDQRAPAK